MAHLGIGQVAGDEEADRAERVRPPHPVVGTGRARVRHPQGVAGADIEEQGAGALDDRGQPVDALGLEGPQPSDPALRADDSRGIDADHLPVQQQPRSGEEEGADEVDQVVGPPAHLVGHPGHRGHGEAGRTDGEQHCDPPPQCAWSPPGGSGGGGVLLTGPAGLPPGHGPIGQPQRPLGHERTEPAPCDLLEVIVERGTAGGHARHDGRSPVRTGAPGPMTPGADGPTVGRTVSERGSDGGWKREGPT